MNRSYPGEPKAGQWNARMIPIFEKEIVESPEKKEDSLKYFLNSKLIFIYNCLSYFIITKESSIKTTPSIGE